MRRTSKTSLKFSDRNKGTKQSHHVQAKRFYKYLQTRVVTCSMACRALKIPQKCLTRYKRDLEKAGVLWEVKYDRCMETGFWAFYITTDPYQEPKNKVKQIKLAI